MSSGREIARAHASSASKITVRTFLADRAETNAEEADAPPQNYVLIEGDATALRFLAKSILALADSEHGCTMDYHPNGAGSIHFSDASTFGIFGHRLPCALHPGNVVR
jgi:hypothetical protein